MKMNTFLTLFASIIILTLSSISLSISQSLFFLSFPLVLTFIMGWFIRTHLTMTNDNETKRNCTFTKYINCSLFLIWRKMYQTKKKDNEWSEKYEANWRPYPNLIFTVCLYFQLWLWSDDSHHKKVYSLFFFCCIIFWLVLGCWVLVFHCGVYVCVCARGKWTVTPSTKFFCILPTVSPVIPFSWRKKR